MKFKKIEISAFRIYDKVQDATFNFVTPRGTVANFVSLYAPNGFGKTSFYDAVEWGVTNNVQRFWQNDTITDRSISTLREITDKQISLLRNTNSLPSTKSFVTITTEDEMLPPRTLSVHGNFKADIQKKDVCENEDFRKVILSQEWISAFLKEVNGERRYKIFIEHPDLIKPNIYYQDVKGLFSLNNSRIDSLREKIDEEKKKVIEIGAENLLETVNNCIHTLIIRGEVLKAIDLKTTDKDVLNLKDGIAQSVVSLDRKIETHKLTLDKLAVAKTGDETNPGIELYYEHLNRFPALSAEIEVTTANIKKFEEIQDLKNEYSNANNQSVSDNAVVNRLRRIISNFPAFDILYKSIGEKQQLRASENEKLIKIRQSWGALRTQEKELVDKLNFNNGQIGESENRLSNLPTLTTGLESLRLNVTKIDTDIVENKKTLESWNATRTSALQNLEEMTRVISEVKESNYSLLTQKYWLEFDDRATNLTANEAELSLLKSQLEVLNSQIEEQKLFSSTIEEFAKLGLSIINNTNQDECPFCCNKFESYNALAEKVAKNHFLNNVLQQLLTSTTDIQSQISKLQKTIEEEKNDIYAHFSEEAKGYSERLEAANGTIKSISTTLRNLEKLKAEQMQKIVELSKELNGLDISEYQAKLEQSLTDLRRQNNQLNRQLSDLYKKLRAENENEIAAATKVGMAEEDIVQISENVDYLEVHDWFRLNAPSVPIEVSVVSDALVKLLDKIDVVSAKMLEMQKTIAAIEVELSSYDLQILVKNHAELAAARESLTKSLAVYSYYFEKEFNVDIKDYNQESLQKLIEDLDLKTREEILQLSDTVQEYLKLERYSENLMPFLQSENAKSRMKKMKKDLDHLKKKVLPHLHDEITKVKAHLEAKIKEFFYTGLINQIYNKIDPHPDFRAVKFKANFDSDNPTLDVLVTDMEDKQTLIPNLYFSSAQINILSLSIFLASALNSSKYDCIFVDDPIQSMDSINVLSMIDLLRSIVINEGKQIILSTHDENFHNLLKKKIPSDFFDSKFMELETFGKVKEDSIA